MKTRVTLLILGIALGAYFGGFLSSETITYYNYSQTVSFEPAEIFGEENVTSATVTVPAVDENGNGVATLLEVQIVPGARRALVDIDKLLFWTDTQNSIRVSRSVSENVTGIDLSYFDIMYSILANATVIEGPSAGAAMTVATIAALTNRVPDPGVMISGTINHDGTIGPVGEVIAKAIAAKQIGARLFLVPPGQSEQVTYENEEHCTRVGVSRVCNIVKVPVTNDVSEASGIEVMEVANIDEAMIFFFGTGGKVELAEQ